MKDAKKREKNKITLSKTDITGKRFIFLISRGAFFISRNYFPFIRPSYTCHVITPTTTLLPPFRTRQQWPSVIKIQLLTSPFKSPWSSRSYVFTSLFGGGRRISVLLPAVVHAYTQYARRDFATRPKLTEVNGGEERVFLRVVVYDATSKRYDVRLSSGSAVDPAKCVEKHPRTRVQGEFASKSCDRLELVFGRATTRCRGAKLWSVDERVVDTSGSRAHYNSCASDGSSFLENNPI